MDDDSGSSRDRHVSEIGRRGRDFDHLTATLKSEAPGQAHVVILAGPSGEDTTEAAQAIANALDMSLYRIDLGALVGKYLDETEQNLSRVFDAASDDSTVLFFDEADALFGKRTEVADAHDRYAEAAGEYLRQRIDASGRLVLLTVRDTGRARRVARGLTRAKGLVVRCSRE